MKSKSILFIAFLVILNIVLSLSTKKMSNKNLSKSKTKVIVETLDGRSTFFNLSSSETIEDLKREIFKTKGIDVENQRIVFNGQEVKGRMSDLNIGGKTVVNLILQINDN